MNEITPSKELIAAEPEKHWPLGNPAQFTDAKKLYFLKAIHTALTSPPSIHTRRAIEMDLKAFFDVENIKNITITQVLETTPDHALTYRQSLEKKGYANATICRRMSSVRRLYKLLQRQNLITFNPLDVAFVPMPSPKADEIITAPLTAAEALKILMVPTHSWNGRRNYMMMILAFVLGLRRSEIANIRAEQIHRNAKGQLEFEIPIKHGKQRVCIIDQEVEVALHRWVELRGDQNGPLFPSCIGKPQKRISESQIWYIFHRAAEKAGIQREDPRPEGKGSGQKKYHISPHSFRAGCIVEMFSKHIPVDQIKKFIRHESAATTIRYTERADINYDKINEAMRGFVSGTINRRGKSDR
jgi:site-specific recombinase XerD